MSAFICGLPSTYRLELWDAPCLWVEVAPYWFAESSWLSCQFTILGRPPGRAVGLFILTRSYRCIFALFALFNLVPSLCLFH